MQHASHVIHVVDDDSSFRSAMARLLSAAGYEVALYETSQQLLDRPPTNLTDCILLDVQMPGLSGLQLQDRLSKLGNRLPIVFLTGHADIPTSVRAIKAGAEDFLTKPVTREQLLETIRRALDHAEQVRARSEEADALLARVASLTPRERQVFALVVRGMLNKQIAHELGTSERTVKAHRHMVMQKCGVRSVAELVMIAGRTGILPSDGMLAKTMRANGRPASH
jgi:RNA polymerase sigma factor (sigma-70 family)